MLVSQLFFQAIFQGKFGLFLKIIIWGGMPAVSLPNQALRIQNSDQWLIKRKAKLNKVSNYKLSAQLSLQKGKYLEASEQ